MRFDLRNRKSAATPTKTTEPNILADAFFAPVAYTVARTVPTDYVPRHAR